MWCLRTLCTPNMTFSLLIELSTTFQTCREVDKKGAVNYYMFWYKWRGWHGDSIFLGTCLTIPTEESPVVGHELLWVGPTIIQHSVSCVFWCYTTIPRAGRGLICLRRFRRLFHLDMILKYCCKFLYCIYNEYISVHNNKCDKERL